MIDLKLTDCISILGYNCRYQPAPFSVYQESGSQKYLKDGELRKASICALHADGDTSS